MKSHFDSESLLMRIWRSPFAHCAILFLIQQVIYMRLGLTSFSDGYLLKWDFLDFHYLANLFNSDAYRSGEVPLWNPLLLSGTPWGALLETKVFYPVQLCISLVIGYSYKVMQAEFMLTVLFAGCGLFAFLRKLRLGLAAAYFGSVSYMASGIFVGNAEHFGVVIVYSFAPWIFLMVYNIHVHNKARHSLWGALFLACAILGGYPGAYIVLCYLLFVVSVALLFQSKNRGKTTRHLLLLCLFSLGLSAVLVVPGFEAFRSSTRAAGLPYDIAVNQMRLLPINLLSVFFPGAATAAPFVDMNVTDISMTNVYSGCVALFFEMYALIVHRKNTFVVLVSVLTVLCVAAALGGSTVVRPFTYAFLPLLDQTRHSSSIFRGYAIFGLLTLASFGVDHVFRMKTFPRVLYGAVPLVCVALLYGVDLNAAQIRALLGDVPVLLSLIFLYGMLFFLWSKGLLREKALIVLFISVLVVEFSWAVRTNSVTLWQYAPEHLASLRDFEKSRDRHFSRLQNEERIAVYPSVDSFPALMMRRRLDGGILGEVMSDYEAFMRSRARSLVLQGHVLIPKRVTYVRNWAEALRETNSEAMDPTESAVVEAAEVFPEKIGTSEQQDAAVKFLGMRKFTLNRFEFAYRAEQNQFVIVNETYVPGWIAHIQEDGRPLVVLRTNLALRGMFLPAGSWTVAMEYSPVPYRIGRAISLFSIGCLVACGLCSAVRKWRRFGAGRNALG